jgi:penicillin amidase
MKNKNIFIYGISLISIIFALVIYFKYITGNTLNTNYIKNKIEISKDHNGVSYINAKNVHDAYFAIGFVHARDRLWQMDFLRRNASGRISEILGTQSIPYDKFIKLLDFENKAEHDLKLLSRQAREVLESYAQGINSYIEKSSFLSTEFYILGYKPEPWTAKDTFIIAKLMSVNLSGNWWKILTRGLLASQNVPTEEIIKFWTPEDIKYSEALKLVKSNYKLFPYSSNNVKKNYIDHEIKNHPASNAWVIDGSHTITGKPLLANDPHVMLTAPSQWYLLNIKIANNYILSGATIPGIPFTVIGHNNNISWGITAAGSDTQDLFIEKFGPKNNYLNNGTYKPIEVKHDILKIKGNKQISFKKRYTKHGPLISDVNNYAASLVDDQHGVALSFVALKEKDLTLQALYELNFSKNWYEFLQSLKNFVTPHVNFLYADINNNIGTISPGKIPIRSNKITFFPTRGWDEKSEWLGYIPFNNLPQEFNPKSGLIINANNKITTKDKNYYLGFAWEPKYRAQRIYNLLIENQKHSIDSFKMIQNDIFSPIAKDFISLIINKNFDTSTERKALVKLKYWDFIFDKTKAEPLIFETWLNEIKNTVFSNNLTPKLDIYLDLHPKELKLILNNKSDKCSFLTNNDCYNIAITAFQKTVLKLREKYGSEIDNWQWGKEHKIHYTHPIFDNIPLFNLLLSKQSDANGNNYTVNCSVSNPNNIDNQFVSVYGSSLRVIYDLSNLNNSLFIITPGQSGNIFSNFYDNLIDTWTQGEYITFNDDPSLMINHITLLPFNTKNNYEKS